ncbi:MAG: hypothetical protein P8J89_04705 [Phycisphaerales bacterium]|nr:hypothetical protein [Phycisphaerales bacterium]|tara:strand:- start:2087 stop:2500 length:414 start_codon:yes stop_codon:yes gene_type:complete
MMRSVLILSLPLVLFCTGCSNLYLAHYQGKQFKPTNEATRVMTAPDASTADLIGVSTFSTDETVDNAQAIAAAERVGANMVQWDRSFQGKSTQLELRPMFGPYTSGTEWAQGGSLIGAEIPVEESWHRYHARFYRLK